MSNIYRVKLRMIKNEFTDLVNEKLEKLLPSLEISISSEVELNDVVLAMLINNELDKYIDYKKTGIIFSTEYYSIYNRPSFNFGELYRTHDSFPYALECIEYEPSEKVSTESKWHIKANLLQTIGYVALLNGWDDSCEGYLTDSDPHIFFDSQHSGYWHTEESADSDYSVQVSGTISYYRDTDKFEIELCPEYSEIQVIFDDPDVQEYLKKITKGVFDTPEFRTHSRFDF